MNETSQKLSRRDMLKIVGSGAAASVGLAASLPVATQDEVTLTFWRPPFDTRGPMGIEALANFYDNLLPEMLPGNVTVETIDSTGDTFTRLTASVAAGNPPDISNVDQTWVPPMLDLMAINAMPEGLVDVVGSFGSFANDFLSIDGAIYILPWGWWERGVFYNIDLLEAAGIDHTELPQKLSDMIPFVKELTVWPDDAEEPTLSAWPLAGGTTFDLYTALVDNLGGFWWEEDRRSGFDSDEWEEAWQITLSMFDDFKLDARFGLSALDKFYTGNAYFLSQQLWVGFVLRRDYPEINWGVMTHPTPNGGPPYGWKEVHLGWGNTSGQSGEGLAAAWELWKALYSVEWTHANAIALNYLPGRLEAVGVDPITADNPHWAGAFEKHQPGNSVSPGYWSPEMWTATNTAWSRCYDNNEPVRQVLQELQQEADSILAFSDSLPGTILTRADYEAHPEWTDGLIPAEDWWDNVHASYLTEEQAMMAQMR
ncbi:MAG: extracellular solute-binding protein [Anaerolineaceae bacterium]|nr:extracellular solute-binding protein [Anaerolineaceae bacterium]MCY4022226.1 extracellular solute-binding protein [Anaerolineaceae bacterium]